MNDKNVVICLFRVIYVDFFADFAYYLRKRFHVKKDGGYL